MVTINSKLMEVEFMSLKLSLCIEMIFNEYPFLERIEKAAETGIEAVEFWDWRIELFKYIFCYF